MLLLNLNMKFKYTLEIFRTSIILRSANKFISQIFLCLITAKNSDLMEGTA